MVYCNDCKQKTEAKSVSFILKMKNTNNIQVKINAGTK